MSRRPRDDRGTVSLFVIGLVAIGVLLVGVVADASRIFLRDRALASAADGAAAAAARAVEPRIARAAPDGPTMAELSPAGARAEVERYVATAGLPDRFGPGFGYSVDVTAGVVTVTLRARARLVFAGAVPGPYADGVGLEATSSARSVISG
jgi:uncharacterized membrane protein